MAIDEDIRALCERLGIEGVDTELMKLALSHPSWSEQQGLGPTESNQRLEFLGDAVLGAVVAEFLYRSLPEEDEGELTRLKSEAVRRSTLARIAEAVGLPEFILLGPQEEATGGRAKASILADCLEAVIGAVFLAGGLEAARDLVMRLFGEELERLVRERAKLDPKSELQQLIQSVAQKLPTYVTIKQEGPPHKRTFEVEVRFEGRTLGSGRGRSKQRAQQAAARAALQRKSQWLPDISGRADEAEEGERE